MLNFFLSLKYFICIIIILAYILGYIVCIQDISKKLFTYEEAIEIPQPELETTKLTIKI